jgi:dTMP kinase
MTSLSRKKRKSVFITFEGIEGSGKSTHIALLASYLQEKGYPVCLTREPGGTKIGERLRDLILDLQHNEMDPKTELFLYLASRAQHLAEVIRPALLNGTIVLCDRFTDATLAYQGYGRTLKPAVIRSIVEYAAYGIRPDLTFLLDLTVQEGLRRLHGRGLLNRLDAEALHFHEAVRKGYLALARREPKRFRVISTLDDKDLVQTRIRKAVLDHVLL